MIINFKSCINLVKTEKRENAKRTNRREDRNFYLIILNIVKFMFPFFSIYLMKNEKKERIWSNKCNYSQNSTATLKSR